MLLGGMLQFIFAQIFTVGAGAPYFDSIFFRFLRCCWHAYSLNLTLSKRNFDNLSLLSDNVINNRYAIVSYLPRVLRWHTSTITAAEIHSKGHKHWQLKFIARVTSIGKNKVIIYVLKDLHKDTLENFRNKQVKITLEVAV
jgi:hypothetical protein